MAVFVFDPSPFERQILVGLAKQLVELLWVPSPAVDDEFAGLVAGFTSPALDDEDPAIKRLFPVAYEDDPIAADDFRRFTMDDQRRMKILDAEVVLDGLSGTGVVEVDRVTSDAWIKTLTALRLSLAVRLGVDAAEPVHRDPVGDVVAFMFEVYDWLAWLQAGILEDVYGVS